METTCVQRVAFPSQLAESVMHRLSGVHTHPPGEQPDAGCAPQSRPTGTLAPSAAPATSAPECGLWGQAYLDTKPGFSRHHLQGLLCHIL